LADERWRATMFDREAILAAVDLKDLADELLGGRRGPPRSPTWRCPASEHLQTGRTPPVTVFTTRWGEERWHCHGCGTGGTAIDLVMEVRDVTARDALQELADRSGLGELSPKQARRISGRRRRERPAPRAPWTPQPVPELERYVAECADVLWRPQGRAIRRWLTDSRRLPEDVLRLNRVGADLGPRHQERPDGVPNVCRAVVLPVLTDGQPTYVQLRTLSTSPGFPRYLSCRDALARNPRLGFYQPARSFGCPFEKTDLVIAEGIIDALSATAAGLVAAAYLGADLPDHATALRLAGIPRRLIIAFDPDPPGRAAAYRLGQLLRERVRDAAVMDLRSGDLNACLVRSSDWPVEMAGRVQHAAASLPRPLLHMGIGLE
jgi:hypothetical protein